MKYVEDLIMPKKLDVVVMKEHPAKHYGFCKVLKERGLGMF